MTDVVISAGILRFVGIGRGIAPKADLVVLIIPLEQVQQGLGVEGVLAIIILLDAPNKFFRRCRPPVRGPLLGPIPHSHPFVLLASLSGAGRSHHLS